MVKNFTYLEIKSYAFNTLINLNILLDQKIVQLDTKNVNPFYVQKKKIFVQFLI